MCRKAVSVMWQHTIFSLYHVVQMQCVTWCIVDYILKAVTFSPYYATVCHDPEQIVLYLHAGRRPSSGIGRYNAAATEMCRGKPLLWRSCLATHSHADWVQGLYSLPETAKCFCWALEQVGYWRQHYIIYLCCMIISFWSIVSAHKNRCDIYG